MKRYDLHDGVLGKAGIVALQSAPEVIDLHTKTQARVVGGHSVKPTADHVGDQTVQGAVLGIILEHEQCRSESYRIVVPNRCRLGSAGNRVKIALVEPNDASSLRIWEEVRVRKQFADWPQLWTVPAWHSHQDVRMKVEQDLTAPSAGRNHTSPFVSGRGDRQKRTGPSGGSRTQGNEFGARPAGEVIDIHSRVNCPGGIHRGCSYRVIGVVPQHGSQVLGRCDH